MNRASYTLVLQPADRVTVPKSRFNMVRHHGIYWGKDTVGQHWFIHNHHIAGCVAFVTAEEFLKGISRGEARVYHFSGDGRSRQEAVRQAESMLGRPYDLLSYNCEHYSNEVQYRKPESRQVATGVTMAAVLGLLLFFPAAIK